VTTVPLPFNLSIFNPQEMLAGRSAQVCIEPRFVEACSFLLIGVTFMPRWHEMHLASRLMGQTESKTCIGKGMKHLGTFGSCRSQTPKRRNATFAGRTQIGALGVRPAEVASPLAAHKNRRK